MVVTDPSLVVAHCNVAQKVNCMSDMKGCTTVRYPLITHVFATFLIARAIIRTKYVLCKTTHSLTGVVLAFAYLRLMSALEPGGRDPCTGFSGARVPSHECMFSSLCR